MHNFVQNIIRFIKKDKYYKLDNNISIFNLIEEVGSRASCLFRGWLLSLVNKNFHHMIFIGKNVKIRFKNKINIGRGTIIEDNVYIDGLSLNGIHIGENVTIVRNSIIKCTGVIQDLGIGLVIGNNTGIGAMSFINAQGGIKIGNDVIMGPGVKIFSENHNYDNVNIKIRLQGVQRKGVKIENNCWIGANVTILDGVEIGEGSIVGAGSIVTKSLPSFCVAVGNPAKVIKNRQYSVKSLKEGKI